MSKQELNCSVSKVTVFTDRAMISRKGTIALSADVKQIQIVGLPEDFEGDTLRVGAEGSTGIKILDFKLSSQVYKEVPVAALATLQEERQRFQDQIAALKDEIATIEHQKSFLKEISANKSRNLSQDLDVQRPVLSDWKEVLGFLGEEMRDLDGSKRELELKIRKIEGDIRMIDAELTKFAGATSKTRQIVTVDFELEEAGKFDFELSYLSHDASWKPVYDARVDSKSKKIEISYFGLVRQDTGEDWQGVEVLLSTARPQLGGNAPTLGSWYLSPLVPLPRMEMDIALGSAMSYDEVEEAAVPKGMARSAAPAPMKKRKAEYAKAEVQEGQGSSVVFKTGGRGFVPGSGEPSKLLIMRDEFGNKFNFIAVPKLAEHVYLNAEVTNSTDYPMISGKINLFLDGNFVGHSKLKRIVLPGETFDLQLGVDESIRVTRKLLREMGDEKGLFSKSKVHEYSYEILLESLRDTDETILVQDQLPVSQDEKIKVEVVQIAPAENPEKDKDKLANGVLEWRIPLKSRSKEKLQLGYRVSHPKDLDVVGL